MTPARSRSSPKPVCARPFRLTTQWTENEASRCDAEERTAPGRNHSDRRLTDISFVRDVRARHLVTIALGIREFSGVPTSSRARGPLGKVRPSEKYRTGDACRHPSESKVCCDARAHSLTRSVSESAPTNSASSASALLGRTQSAGDITAWRNESEARCTPNAIWCKLRARQSAARQ